MDEGKTLEEKGASGGRSANTDTNGEVESKIEVTGMEANNGKAVLDGSLPEQSKLEDPGIIQHTLIGRRSSDPPIDDPLKCSVDPALEKIKEDRSDNKLSVMEGDSTGQDHVQEGRPSGHDHVQDDGLTRQDHVQEDGFTGEDLVQEDDGLMVQDRAKSISTTDQYNVQEDDPTGQDHSQENALTGKYHVQEDGSTGQGHVQEDDPMGQDHVQEDGPMCQGQVKKDGHVGQDHVHEDSPKGQDGVHEDGSKGQECPSRLANDKVHNHEGTSCDVSQKAEYFSHAKPIEKTKSLAADIVSSKQPIEKSKSFAAEIDTTAPFESVKAAVSMFGGIIDWKAHKIQMAERRRYVLQELSKAHEQMPILKKKSEAAEESKEQVLKELDNAKRLLEELRLNLERAETEEQQAKQDAELAKLRVEEMEHGIADESSVAAKTQLEVAQARHQGAVSELKSVKIDLENLQNDYGLLLSDRDLAIKNAEEAVFKSKEIERNLEVLTIQMITTKEALESAHASHLEAEENRTTVAMAREEEVLSWEEELKRSEQELENVNQQITESEDLKSKLDKASVLLQSLKDEYGAYMEENHKDFQSAVDSAKLDLEELKKEIEIATDEVNSLKQSASLLNLDLEKEKETLIEAKKREELAAVTVESLGADMEQTISEVELILKKEQEARERSLQLPKQLEEATEEVDQAKLRVQKAYQELEKAKEAANQAKNRENNMISKLNAALKEIEATRASERLALGAISALHESESTRSNQTEPESSGVTLSVEEYYELSRKAKEAEDEANTRVSEAISEADLAKESEINAQSKLEQVSSDIVLKKEQLSTAMDRAEKANERKTVLEQELETRKSETEKKSKAIENGSHSSWFSGKSSKGRSEGKDSDHHKPDANNEGHNNGIGTSQNVKPRKKKKRSFFPRFFMFFTRKKGRSRKNNTS